MGFDINTVELFLAARTRGVDFSRTATLGCQEFYRIDVRARRDAFHDWRGLAKDCRDVERLLTVDGGFADSFLRELGEEEVTTIDASPFEGATRLHRLSPDSRLSQ